MLPPTTVSPLFRGSQVVIAGVKRREVMVVGWSMWLQALPNFLSNLGVCNHNFVFQAVRGARSRARTRSGRVANRASNRDTSRKQHM